MLPSVVVRVARAVLKFDFRLLVNAAPNKWPPIRGDSKYILTHSTCLSRKAVVRNQV